MKQFEKEIVCFVDLSFVMWNQFLKTILMTRGTASENVVSIFAETMPQVNENAMKPFNK